SPCKQCNFLPQSKNMLRVIGDSKLSVCVFWLLSLIAAIVEYLAQKHSAPDHWCPAELQQRARLTEYLSWQPTNIALNCARVFLLRAFYPVVTDTEVPKDKMDEVLADETIGSKTSQRQLVARNYNH
uniref:Uncharacterized protein n=1 Tax=Acanthochromis polyacanthus TaxID=80966 RepID=A0A3Q1FYC3_9TELE